MSPRTDRTGARRKSDVDARVLESLESGAAQSATHIEEMVLDMAELFIRAFPEIPIDAAEINRTPFIARMRLLGRILSTNADPATFDPPDRTWISDTIRGWCAMAIGGMRGPSGVDDVVVALLPYAQDHHFAVREWAWLSIRPLVVADPIAALRSLTALTSDSDERVRRFAVESTRPRSVWGAHVPLLKETPDEARDLLSALKCDDSKYVQDSVANWVNDASKTQPTWAEALVAEWTSACQCANTSRITRRALRSFKAS